MVYSVGDRMAWIYTPNKLLGTIETIEIDEILNEFYYVISGHNVYDLKSLVHYETSLQKAYKKELTNLVENS